MMEAERSQRMEPLQMESPVRNTLTVPRQSRWLMVRSVLKTLLLRDRRRKMCGMKLDEAQRSVGGAKVFIFNFIIFYAAALWMVLLVFKLVDEPGIRHRATIGAMSFVAYFTSTMMLPILLTLQVTDKESKMKVTQMVYGLAPGAYWIGYMLYVLVLSALPTILICAPPIVGPLLIGEPLNGSMMLAYMVAVLLSFLQFGSLAAVLSHWLSSVRVATIIANVQGYLNLFLIVGLYCLLLFVLESGSEDISFWVLHLFGSLVVPGFALLDVLTHVAVGASIEIPNVLNPTGPFVLIETMSPWVSVLFMLVSICVYMVLTIFMELKGEGSTQRLGLLRGSRSSLLIHTDEGAALSIQGLSKHFAEKKAVDDMSFDVYHGEIFGVLGHNGAGKTTLMECLCGVQNATAGEAFVTGYNVREDMTTVRRVLAVCPQSNPFFAELTVSEHLALFASYRGILAPDAQVSAMLASLGLSEKMYSLCGDLSGGQQRRVWVATTLLGDVPVAILDEPTSGMDPSSRRDLWKLLQDRRSCGKTIIFSTHYLEEADLLADRKVILAQGKVQAIGTSIELKHEFGAGYYIRFPGPAPDFFAALLPAGAELTKSTAGEICGARVPFSDENCILGILQELDSRASNTDFSLEMATLEEVFLKLCDAVHVAAAPAMVAAAEAAAEIVPGVAVDDAPISGPVANWYAERMAITPAQQCITMITLRLTIVLRANRKAVIMTFIYVVLFTIYLDYVVRGGSHLGGGNMVGSMPPFNVSGQLKLGFLAGILVASTEQEIQKEFTSKVYQLLISHGVSRKAYDGGFIAQLVLQVGVFNVLYVLWHYSALDGLDESLLLTYVAAACVFQPMHFATFTLMKRTLKQVPLVAALLYIVVGVVLPLMGFAVAAFGEMKVSRTLPVGGGISINVFAFHVLASVLSPHYLPVSVFVQASFEDGGPPVLSLAMSAVGATVYYAVAAVRTQKSGVNVQSHSNIEADAARNVGDTAVLAEEARVRASTGDPIVYKDLLYTYDGTPPVRAVRGVTCGLRSGEAFTLLGPNGAGKSTTIACLTGEVTPTSGSVTLLGRAVTDPYALRALGVCFQEDALWPFLDARGHLQVYGQLKGLSSERCAAQAEVLLRRLQLDEAQGESATFSGGMKRKLCIAIALIGSNPVLLLDEPTSGVDAAGKRMLWDLMKAREQAQTLMLTTHSMEEADALSTRIAIQVNGKLRTLGTADELRRAYGSTYRVELYQPLGSDLGWVQTAIPKAELEEAHGPRAVFSVPKTEKVSKILMELAQGRAAGRVTDFAVTQPSLEQVFLRFARVAEDETSESLAP